MRFKAGDSCIKLAKKKYNFAIFYRVEVIFRVKEFLVIFKLILTSFKNLNSINFKRFRTFYGKVN